jgi:hypothetical protein
MQTIRDRGARQAHARDVQSTEKNGNKKKPNEYPLCFCQMPIGAVVLMSAVHVKAFQ